MQKRMIALLIVGIVAGKIMSGALFHVAGEYVENYANLDAKESYDNDPLWVLSEENVALSDGQNIVEENNVEEQSGYVFQINGTKISMDAPALPVIAKLGAPTSYSETSECLYGDLDKTYQYEGFEISTYMMGDIDYIAAVFITDPLVATPEGVTTNMTQKDMENSYGMSYVRDGDICAYEKDGTGLEFMFDDDEINYIQYLSSIYM